MFDTCSSGHTSLSGGEWNRSQSEAGYTRRTDKLPHTDWGSVIERLRPQSDKLSDNVIDLLPYLLQSKTEMSIEHHFSRLAWLPSAIEKSAIQKSAIETRCLKGNWSTKMRIFRHFQKMRTSQSGKMRGKFSVSIFMENLRYILREAAIWLIFCVKTIFSDQFDDFF